MQGSVYGKSGRLPEEGEGSGKKTQESFWLKVSQAVPRGRAGLVEHPQSKWFSTARPQLQVLGELLRELIGAGLMRGWRSRRLLRIS